MRPTSPTSARNKVTVQGGLGDDFSLTSMIDISRRINIIIVAMNHGQIAVT